MVPHPGGDNVAKDAEAKNIRITAQAYRGLQVAAGILGETKTALASRAILEVLRRDLAGRFPEAEAEIFGGGEPPGPRKKK
jgi:hypothetical protein